MERIISLLPREIVVCHIIPYTYCLQNHELLQDIRSFHSTWTMIERNYIATFRLIGGHADAWPTMMHNMKRYCESTIGDGPGLIQDSLWCYKWCRTVWGRWAPYRRQYFVAEKVPILQCISRKAARMNDDQLAAVVHMAWRRALLDD